MTAKFQLVLYRNKFMDSDISFLRDVVMEHLKISSISFNRALRQRCDVTFESDDVDELQGCFIRLSEAGLPVGIRKIANVSNFLLIA